MNLLLLKPEDFIDENRAIISGRRYQHLVKVNRVALDETLKCGKIGGMKGEGKVLKISGSSLEIEVSLTQSPLEPLPLVLVLALPRPKVLKRVIQHVTTLGVKEIYLINSWRVEKSYWQSPNLDESVLEDQMILGLEQSTDTIMPKIHQRRFFSPFVKDELPSISEGRKCITAHPRAKEKCPSGIDQPCILAVGPEGGFIDLEIKTLEEIGFLPYNTGKRILKVETAVTSLISRLFL